MSYKITYPVPWFKAKFVKSGISASDISNVAGTDDLSAGTIQATLQALSTRIYALEHPA